MADNKDKKYSWDIFIETEKGEKSNESTLEKYMQTLLRITKLFISILLFSIILIAGIVSKGSILFITSQIRKNANITYCDNNLIGVSVENNVAILPDEERIAWIWILFFAIILPQILTFLRSARVTFFKNSKNKWPSCFNLCLILIIETFNVTGNSLLVFLILPEINSFKGLLITSCVYTIPGIIRLIHLIKTPKKDYQGSSNESKFKNKLLNLNYEIAITIIITALVSQLFVFIWISDEINNGASPVIWLLPLAIFLISFEWWENYTPNKTVKTREQRKEERKQKLESATDDQEDGPYRHVLLALKQEINSCRYTVYFIVSFWKLILYFILMISLWGVHNNISDLFTKFHQAFNLHNIPIYKTDGNVPYLYVHSDKNAYHSVLAIQIFSAFICYQAGKLACRIMVQSFSYATPLYFIIPVALLILQAMVNLKLDDPCHFQDSIPPYLFFYFRTYEKGTWIWISIFWMSAQIFLTTHVWSPKCERIAPTERLYVVPMYNGFLIDQSMLFNRNINDEPPQTKEPIGEKESFKKFDKYCTYKIPRIIACATMWHETKEEMMQMLKSVIRLDEDQFIRRFIKAIPLTRKNDSDYYEFEAHIFFDDAFEADYPDIEHEGYLNSYVKQLLDSVDEAIMAVQGGIRSKSNSKRKFNFHRPQISITPYGGKLLWILPGGNSLTAHLKNSAKIRHKKRWSQVMYMYYLLGYRLEGIKDPQSRNLKSENTYLLALDGDIDFKPDALHKLIDLMKRNKDLGAACGRIHPIGSGALVWYQKFEYAVGHWLQKATEHVIGCVLCSPGCFSLFRASALMAADVVARYNTMSTEALHYVQFDQGEDRWLCTLLLQAGYRIEYSAASDAYTHSPEGFHEFYNQRRRWVPSTIANITDLLTHSSKTVKVNSNISSLYILYQGVLMAGTILGPGTILLMLIGACDSVFRWSTLTSIIINAVPVLIFMLICYFGKPKTQTTVALIYTLIYSVLMLAVLIGILIQIGEDGILAPTSLFFFLVSGQIIIAALLHPYEISCLIYAVVYYVTVPSMYMLLIIYSLFNMNNVSWGTRETPVRPPPQSQLKQENNSKKKEKMIKKNRIQKLLMRMNQFNTDKGSIECSFSNLFKCIFCLEKVPSINEEILSDETNFDQDVDLMDDLMTRQLLAKGTSASCVIAEPSRRRKSSRISTTEPTDDADSVKSYSSAATLPGKMDQINQGKISWILDTDLHVCNKAFIAENEKTFWKEILEKYLKPIEKDADKEKKIGGDLKTLRDKVVMGFLLINVMFVTLISLMQMNKSVDILNIEWPLTSKAQSLIEYDYLLNEVKVTTKQLLLEPIGLLFLFSFGIVLIIQFIAMLYHRLDTFVHYLASTDINMSCSRGTLNQEENSKEWRSFIKHLIRQEEIIGENTNDYGMPRLTRTEIENYARDAKNIKKPKSLYDRIKQRIIVDYETNKLCPEILRQYFYPEDKNYDSLDGILYECKIYQRKELEANVTFNGGKSLSDTEV